jgi:hypothetical protein
MSTSKYTLCCALEDRLIVKTVLRTEELGENYKKAIARGEKSKWKNILFEFKKLERMCKRVERLKDLCKICGISKEQVLIERCKIYGFYICEHCCVSVGGYSEKCRNCSFDIYTRIRREIPVYII